MSTPLADRARWLGHAGNQRRTRVVHIAGAVWQPLPNTRARGSALCRPRLPLTTIRKVTGPRTTHSTPTSGSAASARQFDAPRTGRDVVDEDDSAIRPLRCFRL